MSTRLDLQKIDRDGAVQEMHAEALQTLERAGDTRSSFLRKVGVAGAGAVSGGAILGALVPDMAAASTGSGRPPAKTFGKGDIGILNYALTLEYLESAFYTQAKANLLASADAQTQSFINTTARDEAAHVAALKATLGHKAAKQPKFNFGNAVTDLATFKATAFVLENTGVHAYSGQAFNIKSPKVLAAALSIVTVEARHAGAIAIITGGEISPSGAFDTGQTAAKILAAVTKTGFIVG